MVGSEGLVASGLGLCGSRKVLTAKLIVCGVLCVESRGVLQIESLCQGAGGTNWLGVEVGSWGIVLSCRDLERSAEEVDNPDRASDLQSKRCGCDIVALRP